MTSCEICTLPFTKSTRSSIHCSNCNLEACKECVKRYLLGSNKDPHCMKCKQLWDNYFLKTNIDKTFVVKTYKEHRKKIALDKQLSLLPDTMNLVEDYKKTTNLEEENKSLDKEMKQLKLEILALKSKKHINTREIYNIKHGKGIKERKKFIMACPNEDCKGFLNTQYKCGLCEEYTCSKCMEVIGKDKNNNDHVCLQSNIDSANLIKKETKPCPKCGERIFKIDGCDQMFCTICYVAFSWNTGEIENSVHIHNPHYYEILQKTGIDVRNPGDFVCGGLVQLFELFKLATNIRIPDYKDKSKLLRLRNFNNTIYSHVIYTELSNIHRIINHILFAEINGLRREARTIENHDELRVKYMMNEITKEKFAKLVIKRDTERAKNRDRLNLYEMVSAIGIELFGYIYNLFNKHHLQNEKTSLEVLELAIQKTDEFYKSIQYFNNQVKILTSIYNCKLDLLDIELVKGIGYLRQYVIDRTPENQYEYRSLKFIKQKYNERDLKDILFD